jgi:hypothetical protein
MGENITGKWRNSSAFPGEDLFECHPMTEAAFRSTNFQFKLTTELTDDSPQSLDVPLERAMLCQLRPRVLSEAVPSLRRDEQLRVDRNS